MNGELVYQALEREIILGHLKPRERLLETDLCLRLGVSRTLLREVFRRLEGAGLVTLQPNRGVVVRDFTPQEVEDVYYLRTALERAAVPLILQRLAAGDLKALRAIQRDFERAWRARDMAGMILSNLAFHRRLDEISGNPFLCQSLQVSHLQTPADPVPRLGGCSAGAAIHPRAPRDPERVGAEGRCPVRAGG